MATNRLRQQPRSKGRSYERGSCTPATGRPGRIVVAPSPYRACGAMRLGGGSPVFVRAGTNLAAILVTGPAGRKHGCSAELRASPASGHAPAPVTHAGRFRGAARHAVHGDG